jgi:hypothetical protein
LAAAAAGLEAEHTCARALRGWQWPVSNAIVTGIGNKQAEGNPVPSAFG